MRDPRYDVLFESVAIGPLTARNRFFQVPHCCGMGYRYPQASAAMRGVKAEGGWAVVCTEETEIHPSGDIAPALENRIWDEHDIEALSLLTEAVHAHDSLAGIELCHNGAHAANLYSREAPLAPSHTIVDTGHPVHAREMTKRDIANLRRWHVNAARRAKQAGFDLIYVYAGHDMSLLQHFISRRHNHRTDEYGGSLENRVRLLKEVLEDTKAAVGDTCAVGLRFAVEEFLGKDGIESNAEGHDIVAMLAELPDLWDVNVADWSKDSATSRFESEGYQEEHIRFVKSLTTKPVVGVGRYTSPDSMVRVIREGIMDFIGAARPSIADPFLPNKIQQGRIDDIRECIGCNICVTGDNTCTPIRCTQNPSMGEEWRKGWHPENISPIKHNKSVLIVGGGPAGLEAARACAARGLDVTIADADSDWGGRARRESRLPGLNEWRRVRDWRVGQLQQQFQQAKMFLQSQMNADAVLEHGSQHVVIATGSRWRHDCAGRTNRHPVAAHSSIRAITPDDLLADSNSLETLTMPVVVYDTDGYYMGGVIAEQIASTAKRVGRKDVDVTLLTPDPIASPWTVHSLEQGAIQRHLLQLGVKVTPLRRLVRCESSRLITACVYSECETQIACATLIAVTSRLPEDSLYLELKRRQPQWSDAGIERVDAIGDCHAPGTIAAAVYSGHRYAQEFDLDIDVDKATFKRERIVSKPRHDPAMDRGGI